MLGHGHSHHEHHAPRKHGFAIGPLAAALGMTAMFAAVELVCGAWFGSLALMSDAGHMFSDATALAIAAIAAWVARRPPSRRHSYGFSRAEIVAAFINGLALLTVVVLIFVEAVKRLLTPEPVMGLGVAIVALVGLVINLVVLYLLGQSERDMNTRAATLHVFGDIIGSVAALTAGAVIYATGWQPIDALLSMVIAVLILTSTLRLLRDALHVLMEGVPAGIQFGDVGEALAGIEGVRSVHDLHIWSIASGQIALSAHVEVEDLSRWPVILENARKLVHTRFGIGHVTLQPEVVGGINTGWEAVVKIVPRE